jgi:hypothetical protein
MKQFEWKITNRLLDGTEIEPGKPLPLTTKSETVFRRTAEIVREAIHRKEAIA